MGVVVAPTTSVAAALEVPHSWGFSGILVIYLTRSKINCEIDKRGELINKNDNNISMNTYCRY